MAKIENRDTVISDMGALSQIGKNVADYLKNLIKGKCEIGNVTRSPVESQPSKIEGDLKAFDSSLSLNEKLSAKQPTTSNMVLWRTKRLCLTPICG